MSGTVSPLLSGDLDTQIEILQLIETSNGKGGYASSWQVVARPWAQVVGQDGREAIIGQALQGVSTYLIRLRYRRDITADMQVRLGGPGGTDLNIVAPPSDPAGRREQLMILASTASAQKTS